jgi:hypothetical protein
VSDIIRKFLHRLAAIVLAVECHAESARDDPTLRALLEQHQSGPGGLPPASLSSHLAVDGMLSARVIGDGGCGLSNLGAVLWRAALEGRLAEEWIPGSPAHRSGVLE